MRKIKLGFALAAITAITAASAPGIASATPNTGQGKAPSKADACSSLSSAIDQFGSLAHKLDSKGQTAAADGALAERGALLGVHNAHGCGGAA